MNVGFVGMGNMGQMLVAALARSGVLQPGEMVVSNRSHEKLLRLSTQVPGIQVAPSNTDLAGRCSVIFLCVKPGDVGTVLHEMAPYITPAHLIVYISNTIDNSALESAIHARVAKVIPSVVQNVRQGISLLIFGNRCNAEDEECLLRLFAPISRPYVLRESQARVASDLTSCGPAFLAYVFRSMAQAARRYQPDLPTEAIDTMIRLTAAATCDLMEQQGLAFEDVIARVSTPGGVTADGIKVLDEHMAGVWEQVIETTIAKEAAKKARVEL